ncbi:ATP-dependent RNA helicase DDX24 isoform X2 [Dromiciops gliroides]|uniref:ATP-dependent RNA helicase DDX24 isoform X2 n=1 Tax=Dromiciops gliroides TaxID=33562 RepID=UPI001CC43114|nr:ATP-dependent RNA helicase DDX24 isoform X2 [Dromiciops gliroides]
MAAARAPSRGITKFKKGRQFLPSARFRKKGIKVVGTWKPVKIDPHVFADGQLEDLVCFEELHDYKLVGASKLSSKEKPKKRRSGAEVSEGEREEETTSQPKKKRKKNRDRVTETTVKKEKENPSVADEDLISKEVVLKYTLDTDCEDGPQEGGVVETISPPKKEKKKKKKTGKKAQPSSPAAPSKVPSKVKTWTAKLDDQKADVSAWKDLFVPEPVLQALSSLGFSAPTPIQALALAPAIRDNLDILGAAETGSGKTLAFAIPMIHSVLRWQEEQKQTSQGQAGGHSEDDGACSGDEGDSSDDSNETLHPPPVEREEEDEDLSHSSGDKKESGDIKLEFDDEKLHRKCSNPLLGLVLTPTRELAVQVKHHIDAVAKFTGIRTALLVGGMAPQKQQRLLTRRPEIVIATPGRLWELIKEQHHHLSNLKQLRCLVIDEADRMVERGHFVELSQLLEMLNDSQYNPQRQTFVFSATLTLVHQAPARVFQKKNAKKIDKTGKLDMLMQKIGMRGKPKVIDLTRKEATVETLTETKIHCDKEEKDFYLYYFLLQYPGRTMVFANSIDCIKRLTALLSILDRDPLPLHANMHQKQRLKNLERFAERDNGVLLSTDVAARGLDIPDVQHVIHYQVPRTSEIYVHRSGRTARAAKEGLSLLLIGPEDMINFKKIYKTLEKNEEIPLFPIEIKCMKAIKERVNLARQIEKEEYYNSRAKQHDAWFQQAADALEIDLDDDVFLGGRRNEEEESQKQKMMKGMKKQLKHLLSQPVFKNLMKTKYPTQFGRLTVPEVPLHASESALSTVSQQKKKRKKKQPVMSIN